MALVSPGVEVTIIDQSQYLPASSNSVPLILLATAQNKANAAGTGVAVATTKANANKLYTVTSQRDLVNLYGNPFFYKTTNGTSIQGYELNEYGLLAAYSLLGATNRCFVLRADIDLGSLVGTLSRPTGNPADGTYWLDTTNTDWGIYQFSATTGRFTNQTPLVITDDANIVAGYPSDSLGTIGSYAIMPNVIDAAPYTQATYFYKNYQNTWVELGTPEWKLSIPTVTGTNSNPSLTGGDEFTITVNGDYTKTITISGGWTVNDVANAINNIGDAYLLARVESGKLIISLGAPDDLAPGSYISLANTVNNPLSDLGLPTGTSYSATVYYGTSAQMPLWTTGQTAPHPTGSVWIKTSISGTGIDLVTSRYDLATDAFLGKNVSIYSDLTVATADIDTSGGATIGEGEVVAIMGSQIPFNPYAGMQMFVRSRTGETIVTGTVSDPTITAGLDLNILASTPGQSIVNQAPIVLTTSGTTAASFVTDLLALNIPYVDANVTANGQVQIIHTEGGDIGLSDFVNGQSNGLLDDLGFTFSTEYVTYGTVDTTAITDVDQTSSTGSGSGIKLSVSNYGTWYQFQITNGGSGYAVNELVTIAGADIGGSTPTNNLVIKVQSVTGGGTITGASFYSGTPRLNTTLLLSNWTQVDYIANEGAPATNPLNNTNWFYSTATQVDIMVQKNGDWIGYKNTNYDSNGHPINTGSNATDPLGVIMNTDAPETQTDGSALVYGDLWLDTNDLENYPMLYRWQQVDGVDQWVLIDTADQTSQNGILFADARWATNSTTDPVSDPIPTIVSLLTSDYLDLDAPDPALYPQGMLLWNTRRSGYNVKQFRTNYFTAANYPGETLPSYSYTWVTASGLNTDGSPYMGRKAQRNMVVQALKASIGTNQSIREEDTFFNLIACPNYPELQPDMVTLNNDRNNTAYIVGDTPLRLSDSATDITAWATNAAGASSTGEDGLVTRDTYLGLFYPSGITTDLTGAAVVVPASHMMLRTILRNDTIAYPWFAPAGTRRGNIDNATNIGYLDATTGEFVVIKNRMGIRDVLYTNQINPLAFFTGVGLLNYGNKNSLDSQSALDRINVARLVAYIRERLQVLARPFVFEPNDSVTRNEITGVTQTLFIDLVAKRGLYDYLVVCDESNNTPARIDRNELWIDIAIEPVKAAEFIYIPVRVLNTGELANFSF